VLLQLPVADCPCDTFGQLFSQLVGCGMVCCGLYRRVAVHEVGGREVCYVYTNPDGVSSSRPGNAYGGNSRWRGACNSSSRLC
jgi:hypothetical protein